jgi:hypothetical protein
LEARRKVEAEAIALSSQGFGGCIGDGLRVPTKPAMHSNLKPATYSDVQPAGVPI